MAKQSKSHPQPLQQGLKGSYSALETSLRAFVEGLGVASFWWTKN